MRSNRVLLVANDYVGHRMAGPGIRYYHFARELGKRFTVTLLVPNAADAVGLEGVSVVRARRDRRRQLRDLLRDTDVVVGQGGLDAWTMAQLSQAETVAIYDLYVPFSEALVRHATIALDTRRRDLLHRAYGVRQRILLSTGNAFLCAGEAQRLALLGSLAVAGRIDLERYRRDPSLADLVSVVPFGVAVERPTKTRTVLKGVIPGIAPTDRVVIWGGNIWNWLDPLTPIRAIGAVAETRDDVKLFFLGVRHPNPTSPAMEMQRRAAELSDSLGLTDRHVFFNDDWVPYKHLYDYLLEADIGISAHYESVETLLSYRTRMLDYLQAELPMAATTGDLFARLIEDEGLGRTFGYEDVEGCARAITELIDDSAERERIRSNARALLPSLTWPNVVAPLVRLIESDSLRPCDGHEVRSLLAEYAWLRVRLAR